jgi:hypothetical protein
MNENEYYNEFHYDGGEPKSCSCLVVIFLLIFAMFFALGFLLDSII